MSTPKIHTGSRLFQVITDMQADRPWGNVLDAGTGRSSMNWLLSLHTTSWTAVTGAQSMADQVKREFGNRQRPQDKLLVGNWSDPELLAGQRYETVLADYLLGAMDGFSPYAQDLLFGRLRPLVKQRFYLIGLEPYVPYSSSDPAGALVVEIGRLRDACLLLAGERPYREYPMDWVLRHLRQAGLRCLDAQRFAIRYGERFINSQLDMCMQRTQRFKDRTLAVAMSEHIAHLRRRSLSFSEAEGGLRHGYDYVIAAEPM